MGAKPQRKRTGDDDPVLSAIEAISREVARIRQSQASTEQFQQVEAFTVARVWLPHIFPDGKNLLAYILSDGERTTREIGKHVGVDQKTVSTWWRAWKRVHHIADKAGNRGQFKARFSLAELVAIEGKPPAALPSKEGRSTNN